MTKRPSESAMAAARLLYTPCKQCGQMCEDQYGRTCKACLGEGTNAPNVREVARAIDKAVEPYDKLLTAVLSQLAFDGEVHADTRAAIGALIAPARGAQGGTDE